MSFQGLLPIDREASQVVVHACFASWSARSLPGIPECDLTL